MDLLALAHEHAVAEVMAEKVNGLTQSIACLVRTALGPEDAHERIALYRSKPRFQGYVGEQGEALRLPHNWGTVAAARVLQPNATECM